MCVKNKAQKPNKAFTDRRGYLNYYYRVESRLSYACTTQQTRLRMQSNTNSK